VKIKNKKLILSIIIFDITIAVSLCSLLFFTAPFVWIGFACFGMFVTFAIIHNHNFLRPLFVNMSVAILTLSLFETYFFMITPNNDYKNTGSYAVSYFKSDDLLGYAPQKNVKVTSTKYFQDECLYDVVYTIDKNGLRKTPDNQNNADSCIVFFGGSFTFGEGLQDTETLPNRVSVKTNMKYNIYNFGFHGYGTHHMLAAIEFGLVEKIVHCQKNAIFIYQAISHHINRASGLSEWDAKGPKYELVSDNDVRFMGHFDDKNIMIRKVLNQCNKSFTFVKLFSYQKAITDNNIKLFSAIIKKSENLLTDKYKNVSFYTILWDDKSDKHLDRIKYYLNFYKINVHLISNIIPDINDNKSKYSISPNDKHPNALANDIIATYIVENLL